MSNTFVQSEPADETQVTQEITDGAVDQSTSTPESSDTLPSEKTDAPAVPEKFLKEDGSVDHDAVLKSYLELEKKGSSDEEAAQSEGEGDETAEGDDEDGAASDRKAQEEQVNNIVEEAGFKMEDLSAHVDEHGDLSDEHYAKFEEMGYPEEMARMYVRGLQASAKDAEGIRTESYELAGGQEAYGEMIEWAADNLSEAEIEAHNDAVYSLDKARTLKAIQVLKAKFDMAAPVEPNLTVEGGETSGADTYANEAEYMSDMMDRRYETNEAYRNKVIAKRMRSNY